MAIASIPTSFFCTQGNIQVFLQWDITAGATSYTVQRSTDGVTFSTLASPTVNNYLDTAVTSGTKYYYQVASTNASGNSSYTAAQSIIPTPTGEMSLAEIRTQAQQRADMENNRFITLPEWNTYINQAMFELYDLLITSYEDYFIATPASFTTTGNTNTYALPDGITTFQDNSGANFVASPFYKLIGVDLAINNASVNGAYVTINKFNFIDRNTYVYPNSGGSIYGVFNMRYRVMGTNIQFIPTPTGNQTVRLWYIPKLTQLLQDTDVTTIGVSGWLEYVIVRAAIYALTKEESDTSGLEKQIIFLKQRIEETAVNRDAGQPDKISDTRSTNGTWGPGSGFGGTPSAGW